MVSPAVLHLILDENKLENVLVNAFNQFLNEKEKHMARLEKLLRQLSDTATLEKQLDAAKTRQAR